MTVDCISSCEAVEQHRQQWETLLASVEGRHPFLEPDWLLVWLRHFGRGAQPYVLSAHDSAGLIGLFPLVSQRSRWMLGARVLTFPGQALADYQGLVVPEGASQTVGEFAAFLAQRKDWDLLWLSDLRDDGWGLETLVDALRVNGLKVVTLPSLKCPYLSILERWPDYYSAARSGGARKNLDRSLRRLGERGELAFRHYTVSEEVSGALENTFRLHEARWFDRFTTTPYSNASGKAFFRDLADAYARRDLLDLSTLELDGRPIAFSFSFRYPGSYFYYIPAFDPGYASYSPGTLLMIHLMEKAFDNGNATFDFMKGDEPYKWRWTSSFRTNIELIAAGRTVSGQAALRVLSNYRRVRERARRSGTVRRVRREGFGRALGAAKRLRRRR